MTTQTDLRPPGQSLPLLTPEVLRQIANNLPVFLALSNADLTHFLFINNAYESIWGRSAESLYPQPLSFLDHVHPNDREQLRNALDALIQGNSMEEFECRVVRPDASLVWIACRGFPIYDSDGHIQRLLLLATDVTARKELQDDLDNREAYLAAGQRIAGVGVWAWNLSSGEMQGSHEFNHIFGFDPPTRDLSREFFLQRIHPHDRPRYQEVVSEAMAEGKDWSVDYRIVPPDGIVKHVHGIGRPVRGPSDELVQYIGTVMDITERKNAEENLRRLSGEILQLQEEERRKVAAELHDTTGQDLVALSAMVSQLRSSLPSSQRKLRQLAADAAAVAEGCIRDIRTLSYLLYPPVLEQIGLEPAILQYLDGFTKRTGVQVQLRVPPNLQRFDRQIELTLFRVVQESLTNIHRHSGSSLAEVQIACAPEHISLQVKDEGSGIFPGGAEPPRAMPPRLGIPSGPEQPRTTPPGVGIPSMRERVNRLGGEFRISSGPRGTNVHVLIPLPPTNPR